MKVEIVPYNPAWPSQFETIKQDLEEDLARFNAAYISIEHVGSTSVPHLAGKDEIDIIIVVANTAHYDKIQEALIWGERQGGYQCIGDGGVQGRRSLKLNGILPRRNVYLDVENSLRVRGHRDFRETLKTDPRLRDEYERVKVGLAEREWAGGVMEYAIAKNAVIRKVLEKAGWRGEELDKKEGRVRLLSSEVEDWL